MSTRSTIKDETSRRFEAVLVGPGIVQEHQQKAPVHLSRRLSQIMTSVVYEQVPKPTARNEFGVLVAISQTPNLDQKRLAAMMAFDTTTIGQLVDNLEEKGLVRRTASATDRRVNIIEMTEAGHKVVAEYRPKVLKAQNDAMACLTEAEKRTLLDLMARVIEANPGHDRPGGGRRAPKSTTK